MKLLFVCTGNTCRSPMAQGLAKHCFQDKIDVISAGISAQAGDEASRHTVKVLQEKGIDISGHRAVRLTREMVAAADLVLTMTKAQQSYLSALYPEFSGKIRCLGDWHSPEKEIPDPWGGPVEQYRRCAREIEKMLQDLASEID